MVSQFARPVVIVERKDPGALPTCKAPHTAILTADICRLSARTGRVGFERAAMRSLHATMIDC